MNRGKRTPEQPQQRPLRHIAAGNTVFMKARVACMGDSITRGNASHEPGDQGTHKPHKSDPKVTVRGNYPLQLQRLLGDGWEVRNFGHGGRSVLSSNAYNTAYDKTAEFKAANQFAPTVVLLMLGTNDAKHCRPGDPSWPCQKNGGKGLWDEHAFGPTLQLLARRILMWPSQPRLVLMAPPPVLPHAYRAHSIAAEILSTQARRGRRSPSAHTPPA